MRDGLSIVSRDPVKTEQLGEALGERLAPGTLICLRGELGAGKTVLVRGLTRGFLGERDYNVTSPTYVLQHVYRVGDRRVYHLDTYRLTGGEEEFETSGLAECIRDGDGLVCLEWPERIEPALPETRLEVQIGHLGPDQRELRLEIRGELGLDLDQLQIGE